MLNDKEILLIDLLNCLSQNTQDSVVYLRGSQDMPIDNAEVRLLWMSL